MTSTFDPGDDTPIARTLQAMASILDSPTYQSALQISQEAAKAVANGPELAQLQETASSAAHEKLLQAGLDTRDSILNSSAVTAALDATEDARRALTRIWTPQVERLLADQAQLLATVTTPDLTKLAAFGSQFAALDLATTRRGLLDLYDHLAEEQFDSPVLSLENIQTARGVVAAVPDTPPDVLPQPELSPETAEEIPPQVIAAAEQLPNAGWRERAHFVASYRVAGFLTTAFFGMANLPEATSTVLEVWAVIEAARAVYNWTLERYEKEHGDQN
ncbi:MULTISPECIES: hypothetical protein [Streptacidiphilus]|uniref:Uncharacterized protein n=1 Tax=Streptacidiphilus cavernicola TaxID=3342716 RepID=A0ABV6V196_9ACTN|nr:hypothetical protein [Streptacidiphilus jeojiense]